MEVAMLNGNKVKLEEIDDLNKDSEFFCVNKKCRCEVIVAAYESTEVRTYFRAKNSHENGCYMEKLSAKTNDVTRKRITKLTSKWTLEDVYNLMNDVELDDPIGSFLTMRDIELSDRNELSQLEKDSIYFVVFTPTAVKNASDHGVIFGKIGESKISVNLKEETEGLALGETKFPQGVLEDVIVVGKVKKSLRDSKRYLMFDVTSGNYDRIKKLDWKLLHIPAKY